MARPLRITFPGAFYHVTSRGNERKNIYKSKRDREKFLEYLGVAHERYGAIIHAYCLMTNHYHLLIETPDANLPQIMKHINSSYSTYFNVKRKRFGHLFQGRYKAQLVCKDDYALELSRYIHLNPVRAKMVETPQEYPWSSHLAYLGAEAKPFWLNTSFILGYFGEGEGIKARREFCRFVDEKAGTDEPGPLDRVSAATILGSESFIEGIRKKYLEGRRGDRELPELRALESRPSFESIYRVVDDEVDDAKLSRNVQIYLMKRYSGSTLKGIGDHFGMKESAVSQVCRRLDAKMAEDASVKKVVSRCEAAFLR